MSGNCEIISFGICVPQKPHLLEKPLKHEKSCKHLGLPFDGLLRLLRYRERREYVA